MTYTPLVPTVTSITVVHCELYSPIVPQYERETFVGVMWTDKLMGSVEKAKKPFETPPDGWEWKGMWYISPELRSAISLHAVGIRYMHAINI